MKKELLTIGDCDIDVYMKIDTTFSNTQLTSKGPEICFYHGSKIPVDAIHTSVAGNAANVAMSATKMGLNVDVYTEIGDDESANRIINELKAQNIGTEFCIKNANTPTNIHSVIVYGDDRTIFSYHEKRNYKIRNWEKPKWLFYSSIPTGFETFQKELVKYVKENAPIGLAFNPGTLHLRSGLEALRDVLSVTDILFLNLEEAQRLLSTNKSDLLTVHKMLNALGPKMSVITLGKDGSSVYDNIEHLQMKSITGLKITDKTGAGDAYTAAFLTALILGKNLKTAMTWGTINSASVITRLGGSTGILSVKEIEEKSKSINLN